MMISPYTFYQTEIKDKPLKEVLEKIKAIRNNLTELEERIKTTKPNSEFIISPSPETKLSCYKDYLSFTLTELIKEEILKLEKNTVFSFIPFFEKYGVLEDEKFKIFAEIAQEKLFNSEKNYEEMDIGLPYNFEFIKK